MSDNIEQVATTEEDVPVVSTDLSEADDFEPVDLSKFNGDFEKLGKSYSASERKLRELQQEKANLKKEADRAALLEQQYNLAVMELNKRSGGQNDEFEEFRQEWEQSPSRAAYNQALRAQR